MVLPLSHYSPVCHALWSGGGEENGEEERAVRTDEMMEGSHEEVHV